MLPSTYLSLTVPVLFLTVTMSIRKGEMFDKFNSVKKGTKPWALLAFTGGKCFARILSVTCGDPTTSLTLFKSKLLFTSMPLLEQALSGSQEKQPAVC